MGTRDPNPRRCPPQGGSGATSWEQWQQGAMTRNEIHEAERLIAKAEGEKMDLYFRRLFLLVTIFVLSLSLAALGTAAGFVYWLLR